MKVIVEFNVTKVLGRTFGAEPFIEAGPHCLKTDQQTLLNHLHAVA